MTLTRFSILILFVACLEGCAAAPPVFRADSAANSDASAAPRFPVATVLAAPDPLAARVCPESGPCVLTNAATTSPAPAMSEHHHHHHQN